MFDAYKKYIKGGANVIDNEEQEDANTFNDRFSKVFKALPRTERKIFLNLMDHFSDLHTEEGCKGFHLGLKHGRQKVYIAVDPDNTNEVNHLIAELKNLGVIFRA